MTEELQVQEASTDPEGVAVYEIAFHVVPVLDEETRTSVVEGIRKSVESRGGTILGEHHPQLLDLSYPMDRQIQGKRSIFHSAYFGWLFAELPKALIEEVQEELAHAETIIRFLVTRTEKAVALEGAEYTFARKGSAYEVSADEVIEVEPQTQEKEEVSEEELDEAIDSLVGDDEEPKEADSGSEADTPQATEEVDEAIEKASQ